MTQDEAAIQARRKRRWGQTASVFIAALLAAALALSFSAGSASAQNDTSNDGTDEQQADDGSSDDDDDDDDDSHDCDRDRDRDGKGRRGANIDTLTEVLGIDAAELRTQLKAGSTIAEVAAANDVAVDDVIDALVAAATARAAEHDKEVDADELTEKFTSLVNGERPDRGAHGGERGLRGRWHRSGAMSS